MNMLPLLPSFAIGLILAMGENDVSLLFLSITVGLLTSITMYLADILEELRDKS